MSFGVGGNALIADIGGTHARFALLRNGNVGSQQRLAVSDYESVFDAIDAYLRREAHGATPERAVLAAAGPPQHGRIQMTNSNWSLDATELAAALGMKRVELVNDFAAQGWALPALGKDALRKLGHGEAEADMPQVVIGPGTGFGMAIRAVAGPQEIILVTEGGHVSIAPETETESALLGLLHKSTQHISVERLLSGPGLVILHDTLGQLRGATLPERDTAAIVEAGVAGTCAICRETLDVFCGWLGGVAGDMALAAGALGGVYIAGGVVLHFLDFMAFSGFRDRFRAKGRLSGYLSQIPTYIVTHPDPAFLGLARYVAVHP